MWSKLILLIMICHISSAVYGQRVISGRVGDRMTGEVLPGANIYLLHHWETGTVSAPDGAFLLNITEKAMEADTIVFSFVGFEELLIPVREWQDQLILLTPLQNKLTEIVVESSALIAEEFQYEKIRKLEVYTNPAAKADPLLAVNSLPSATPSDESANISLRGGNPGQTGVFFNDVPIYDYVKFSQLNGIGVFSIFNTAIVDNLSVFPGNPPLEYGNVSGGMIAISSDEQVAAANSSTVTLSPASFGYFREQKVSDKMSVSLFGNYQPGGILKAINGDAIRGVDQFSLYDGGIYFFARPSEKTRIKVFNYTLSESYRFDFRSATYKGFFNQSRKRNFTTLKWEYKLTDRSILSINSGAGFSNADFAYSQFETHTTGSDLFIGVNYQHSRENMQLKIGWSSDYRYQQSEGIAPIYHYALAEEHPATDFTSDDTAEVNESFAYLKYFVSDRLTIGGGFRAGGMIENDPYLSRQLNLKIDLGSHWSLIAGAGRYHQLMRQLSIERDFVRIMSDQLTADLKYSTLGLNGSFSIFRKINSGDRTLENTIWGVELFLERNIVGRISYNVSASYLSFGRTPPREDIQSGNISYFLRGNLNWNLTGRWILGANLLYREGNLYFPVGQVGYVESLEAFEPVYSDMPDHLSDYFSAGVSISNELAINERSTVIVFSSINNLTDHLNVRAYAYNRDYSERSAQLFGGRTLYFGAVFRF